MNSVGIGEVLTDQFIAAFSLLTPLIKRELIEIEIEIENENEIEREREYLDGNGMPVECQC